MSLPAGGSNFRGLVTTVPTGESNLLRGGHPLGRESSTGIKKLSRPRAISKQVDRLARPYLHMVGVTVSAPVTHQDQAVSDSPGSRPRKSSVSCTVHSNDRSGACIDQPPVGSVHEHKSKRLSWIEATGPIRSDGCQPTPSLVCRPLQSSMKHEILIKRLLIAHHPVTTPRQLMCKRLARNNGVGCFFLS